MPASQLSGCAFNYVVTAHKPTNVSISAVGHFTSPDDINLIVSYVPSFAAVRLLWLFRVAGTASTESACPAQEMHTHRDPHFDPRGPAGKYVTASFVWHGLHRQTACDLPETYAKELAGCTCVKALSCLALSALLCSALLFLSVM